MCKHVYAIILSIILIISCNCIKASEPIRIALIKPIISTDLSNISLGLPNMEPNKIRDMLYQAIDTYFRIKFSGDRYFIYSQEQIYNELLKNGYFVNALALPDINTLKNIADCLEADLSIAIDITNFVAAHYNTRSGVALCMSIRCNAWSRTNNKPYILQIMKIGQDLKLSRLHQGYKPLETFIADLTSDCFEEIWTKIGLW